LRVLRIKVQKSLEEEEEEEPLLGPQQNQKEQKEKLTSTDF